MSLPSKRFVVEKPYRCYRLRSISNGTRGECVDINTAAMVLLTGVEDEADYPMEITITVTNKGIPLPYEGNYRDEKDKV